MKRYLLVTFAILALLTSCAGAASSDNYAMEESYAGMPAEMEVFAEDQNVDDLRLDHQAGVNSALLVA